MAIRPPQSTGWLPYAGFMLAIAGIVYQGGLLSGAVQRNSERLGRLESIDQARSDRIQAIDVRTARIEAKIDLVVPPQEKGPK